METNNVKTHIDHIIKNATHLVKAAYNDESTKTRLCFPKCSATSEDRVSEQEFRFAFVEAFNDYVKDKGLDWRYAVEVPTKDRYLFIEKGKLVKSASTGRSAMFDMVIYSGDKRCICLIEFKSGNPEQFYYDKDYCKLMNQNEGGNDILRYFLQLLKNHDERTIENIKKKTNIAINGNATSDIQVISKAFSLKNCTITEIPIQ